MIVVVEGPSASGKTTWCRRHAPRWLPEPGAGTMDEILRYQIHRWRQALEADAMDEVVVLDGDPFKLYYSWAERKIGRLSDLEWSSIADTTRVDFVTGDLGVADLVLYSDPSEDELRRRQEGDATRTRRNFERHMVMRPFFRRWYEAVARLDPARVVWAHPPDGLTGDLLAVGRRPSRSSPKLLAELLNDLDDPAGPRAHRAP